MSERPGFEGGVNIALKIPKVHYEQTVAFYRDVLGLPVEPAEPGSSTIARSFTCRFGPNTLWLDEVDQYSQTDVWLEVGTPDLPAAMRHLADRGIGARDELEPLPEGFAGHWIASPAGTIHLVYQQNAPSGG